jgi:hypothetical protein
MRVPRESLLFLGMLITGCVLAGLYAGYALGILVGPARPTVPQVLPSPTLWVTSTIEAPISDAAQRTVMIVVVDDAVATDAELQACWVITFKAGTPEYYIVAFPTSARLYVPRLGAAYPMQAIYREDRRQDLAMGLMADAVQARFPAISVDALILLDRADIVSIVTVLGGVPVENRLYNGMQLLQAHDGLSAAGLEAHMAFQRQVFQALLPLFDERNWTPSHLGAFLKQIPRIGSSATTVEALNTIAVDAPPFDTAEIFWQTYTPELELLEP